MELVPFRDHSPQYLNNFHDGQLMLDKISGALASLVPCRGPHEPQSNHAGHPAVTMASNSQNTPLNNQGRIPDPARRHLNAPSFMRFIHCWKRRNGPRTDAGSESQGHTLKTSKQYQAVKKLTADDAVKAFMNKHPKWLTSLGITARASSAASSAFVRTGRNAMPAMQKAVELAFVLGHLTDPGQQAQVLGELERLNDQLALPGEGKSDAREELAMNLANSAVKLEHAEELQKRAVALTRKQVHLTPTSNAFERLNDVPRLRPVVEWAKKDWPSREKALFRIRHCWYSPKGSPDAKNLDLHGPRSMSLKDLPEHLDVLLPELETLNLKGNRFSAIPEAISRFSKLKELDMSMNEIVSLPEEFEWPQSMEKLLLDGNKIKHVPPGFTNMQLYESFSGSAPSGKRFCRMLTILEGSATRLTRLQEEAFHYFVQHQLDADPPKIKDKSIGKWRAMTTAERKIEAQQLASNAGLTWFVDFNNYRCTMAAGYEDHLRGDFIPMRHERVSDAGSMEKVRADLTDALEFVLGYTGRSTETPGSRGHYVIIQHNNDVFHALDSGKDKVSEPLEGDNVIEALDCFLARHAAPMDAAGIRFEYAVYDPMQDPYGSVSQYPAISGALDSSSSSVQTWDQYYEKAMEMPDDDAAKAFVAANPQWVASLGIKVLVSAAVDEADRPWPRAPDGVQKAIQLAFILRYLPDEQQAEALAILEKLTSALKEKLNCSNGLASRKELALNLANSAHALERSDQLQKHAVRLARSQYDFLSQDAINEVSGKIYALPRLQKAVAWAYEPGISAGEAAYRIQVLKAVRETWMSMEGSKHAKTLRLSGPHSVNEKLSSFIPDLHELLPDLATLDLSKSGLQAVPDKLPSFDKLKHLMLPPVQSIPDEIGKMHCLESLTIADGHQLDSLPETIGQLNNLKVLDIGAGVLQSLPSQLSNLRNLQRLYASQNVIESIPEGFVHCPPWIT